MPDIPDTTLLIGLHKLAAERGDGLIPELLALYHMRETVAERAPIMLDGSEQKPAETLAAPAGNDNVIQIRPYLLARRRR